MASITSVVAFFILLLATFSYSAPIGQEYGTSTPEFEHTTNENMGKPVNMRSLVNDESTRVSVPREDRSSEENEVTTEDVTLSPRTFQDSSYSPVIDRKDERNYEEYSTNSPTSESSEERSHEEYSTPSSPKINDKRVYKDSTYPSASESSEEPKREKYSSPSSSKLNEKQRIYKSATYSPKRESSEEQSHEEYSSPSSPRMNEKRVYKESTYPSTSESSEERNVETSSSPLSTEFKPKRRVPGDLLLESSEKRTVEDFLYTTLESSTEFNQRAIRPAESEEEVESSTSVDSKNQINVNKDAEPSSSVHSFGKYTGFLPDEQSSTSEYETTNRPDEESTQDSAVQPERLTKTISIIPGKITETKIFANSPSRTSVVIQPVSQEQLSQVQNQAIAEKEKSNN